MYTQANTNAPPQPDAARGDFVGRGQPGDFVVRRGTFFQVGEYPDKQFALTEAEADAAIARFAPVPLNIEHIPTIFDGKLGMVRRLWREGKDLLAEYAIPRWLHEVTRGEAIKISSEWSRTTKCPQGGAFVLHPRVADAVMLAAFHNTTRTADRAEAANASAAQGNAVLSGRTGDERANGAAFALCAEQEEHTPIGYTQTGQAQCEPAERNHDVKNEDGNHTAGARTLPRAGKELETMSLLSGLKALFQRAGVPASEIDAHLNGTGAQLGEGEDAVSTANRQFSETNREGTTGKPVPASQESEGSEPDEERASLSQHAPSAQFAQMEAELTRLREEARQAQDAQNEARFAQDAQAIETLVRGGRMTPAEADAWQQIARDKPAAFAVVLPALHARPHLPHVGGATIRAGQSHDADRLESLTRQRMREKELDHAQAFREICGENKDLALSVRTQSQEGS